MFKKMYLAVVFSILLLIHAPFTSANSRLIVFEKELRLLSSDFEYPNNDETLDVIWLFDHSIKLKINEFHLDGHSGDFMLISDLPLLNKEHFLKINETSDGSYVDFLAKSILTEHGILLSWKSKKVIQAINEVGTFVLFHTEGKVPEATAKFAGFDIEISNYDDELTTTTSTTPDPVVTAKPGQKAYISKFLSCMSPEKFYGKTEDFKMRIANLSTHYCKEVNITLDKGDIVKTEINIPGPEAGPLAGIHYCDTTWSIYSTCVEVTFAITRLNDTGNYVLLADQLEQMWSMKAEELRPFGYCPFNPPDSPVDLNTYVWVAFFLGIILGLTAILCVICFTNAQSLKLHKQSFSIESDDFRTNIKKVEMERQPIQNLYYDVDNPMYKFIPNHQQTLIRNGIYPPPSPMENDDPFRKHLNTDNPAFEETRVQVYAYDNSGFEPDTRSPRRDIQGGFLIMNKKKLGSMSDTEI